MLDIELRWQTGTEKLTIPFDQNPAIYANCRRRIFPGRSSQKYCCTGASSSSLSTKARLRYSPFNFGGGGLVELCQHWDIELQQPAGTVHTARRQAADDADVVHVLEGDRLADAVANDQQRDSERVRCDFGARIVRTWMRGTCSTWGGC